MTDTRLDDQPDVAAFVARVRTHLADLDDEQREDLLEGLEADLAEQRADGSLPADPAAYADELRAAAGLPVVGSRRWSGSDADPVGRGLDRGRDVWVALVGRDPLLERAWVGVSGLRPAWWVLRAWLAVVLLDQLTSDPQQVAAVPRFGFVGLGLLVLLAAVVGSTLVGRGRLWPGSGPRRRTSSRVVLLALNLLAVAVLGGVVQQSSLSYSYGPSAAVSIPSPGVTVDGRQVRNLYPYDAEGRPITTGVQLFDGAGRPVALSPRQAMEGSSYDASVTVGCPWLNGTQRIWNVYPLPEREQRPGTSCLDRLDARFGPAVLPTPPLAVVPPVVLPAAGEQTAP